MENGAIYFTKDVIEITNRALSSWA